MTITTKHTPTQALRAVLDSFVNDAGVAFVQPDVLDQCRHAYGSADYLTARVAELEAALSLASDALAVMSTIPKLHPNRSRRNENQNNS